MRRPHFEWSREAYIYINIYIYTYIYVYPYIYIFVIGYIYIYTMWIAKLIGPPRLPVERVSLWP